MRGPPTRHAREGRGAGPPLAPLRRRPRTLATRAGRCVFETCHRVCAPARRLATSPLFARPARARVATSSRLPHRRIDSGQDHGSRRPSILPIPRPLLSRRRAFPSLPPLSLNAMPPLFVLTPAPCSSSSPTPHLPHTSPIYPSIRPLQSCRAHFPVVLPTSCGEAARGRVRRARARPAGYSHQRAHHFARLQFLRRRAPLQAGGERRAPVPRPRARRAGMPRASAPRARPERVARCSHANDAAGGMQGATRAMRDRAPRPRPGQSCSPCACLRHSCVFPRPPFISLGQPCAASWPDASHKTISILSYHRQASQGGARRRREDQADG